MKMKARPAAAAWPAATASLALLLFTVVSLIVPSELVLTNFDGTLSPRQVKTKYGLIRGILLLRTSRGTAVRPPVSPSSSSTGTSSSSSIKTSNSGVSSFSDAFGSVEAFLGVPYAAPPVGPLRFMPPVTAAYSRLPRVVSALGPVCPQNPPNYEAVDDQDRPAETLSRSRVDFIKRISPFLRNQSEDCLNLNVYAPFHSNDENLSKRKLPVLVYVHGESYFWGSGNSYDGSLLASFSNIIVITLNYRLGVFGFLSTAVDGVRRGNYGLMDLIAALHWIQDNISEIGGDQNNITVAGHGRGADMVSLLMLSPLARGLFSKAALMSGSAMSPLVLAKENLDTFGLYLGKSVNCPNYEPALLVDCLRTKTAEELLKVTMSAKRGVFDSQSLRPIVDGLAIPADPRLIMTSGNNSLPRHLDPLYRKGRQYGPSTAVWRPQPLLFGVTRIEAPFLFSDKEERQGIDLERRDHILRSLVKNIVDYYQEVVALTLVNEYTDWTVPAEHPISTFDSLVDILGDSMVVAPLNNFANLHHRLIRNHELHNLTSSAPTSSSPSSASKGHPSPASSIFSYVFVHQSERANGGHSGSGRLGCVHGDELPYLFGAPLAGQDLLGKNFGHFALNYTRPEVALSESMMTYWSNFVKFGDPNGLPSLAKQTAAEGAVKWPPYEPNQSRFLMIGLKAKARDFYHAHRLSFWSQLIPRLQAHGKEESELFMKRHLQDQTQNPSEVAVFQRISLKFLNSLNSGGGGSGGSSGPPASDQQHLSGGHTTQINPEAGLLSPTAISTNSNASSSFRSNVNSVVQSITADAAESYSTLLGATIAIGLALLVLNVLVFVGVYYKLHKGRKQQLRPKGSIRSRRSPGPRDGGGYSPCLDIPSQRHHQQHQGSFGSGLRDKESEFECYGDGGVGGNGTICITYAAGSGVAADCCQQAAQLSKNCSTVDCPCSVDNYVGNCCSTGGVGCDDNNCLASLAVIQEMDDEHL